MSRSSNTACYAPIARTGFRCRSHLLLFHPILCGKSDLQGARVVLFEIGDKRMENLEDIYLEKRSLALAAFVYYIVMLAAFIIGLYGLISLIALAANTIDSNAQVISSLL
jgi:hypothetical protein